MRSLRRRTGRPHRLWRRAFLILILPQLLGPLVWSAGPPPQALGRPTAPPPFTPQKPIETFHCERKYTFQGRVLDCDSNLQRDGENLRPVIQEVPAAVAELDAYQRGRRSVQALAYTSTAGLVVAGLSYFAYRQFNTSVPVRNLGLGIGLALTAGSVLYGVSYLSANEERLGNAVRLYNQARPERPIELQFSTGIAF
jgi:hypothetical protein